MTREEALEKVHKGSLVVYEGATNNICLGEVAGISEYGTVHVYDIDTGSNTPEEKLRGEYTRTPEEYFLYDDWNDDDYYLNAQVKKHNRKPTPQEIFWYKLCIQNCRIRDEYCERLERLER